MEQPKLEIVRDDNENEIGAQAHLSPEQEESEQHEDSEMKKVLEERLVELHEKIKDTAEDDYEAISSIQAEINDIDRQLGVYESKTAA